MFWPLSIKREPWIWSKAEKQKPCSVLGAQICLFLEAALVPFKVLLRICLHMLPCSQALALQKGSWLLIKGPEAKLISMNFSRHVSECPLLPKTCRSGRNGSLSRVALAPTIVVVAMTAALYLLLTFSWNSSEIRSDGGLSSNDYTNFIRSNFQLVRLVAEPFVLLFPLDQFGMVVLHE